MVAHSLPRGQRAQVSVCSLNYVSAVQETSSAMKSEFHVQPIRANFRRRPKSRVARLISLQERRHSTRTSAERSGLSVAADSKKELDITSSRRRMARDRVDSQLSFFRQHCRARHLQPELDSVVRLATLSLFSTFFDSNQTHA